MSNVCKFCGKEKDESEFYYNKNTRDHLLNVCKTCHKERSNQYAKTHRKEWNEYCNDKYYEKREFIESLKTPCIKCGESRVCCIEFHHVNPDSKSFSISTSVMKSNSNILKEASKCVCLCANCHAEFHYKYGRKPTNGSDALKQYLDWD